MTAAMAASKSGWAIKVNNTHWVKASCVILIGNSSDFADLFWLKVLCSAQ